MTNRTNIASARRSPILLAVAALLFLGACKDFERNNPVDPDFDLGPEIMGPDTVTSLNQPIPFSIKTNPPIGKEYSWSWYSSNPTIMESNGNGVFIARATGTFTIHATLYHHHAQKTVAVIQRPSSIKLSVSGNTRLEALDDTLLIKANTYDAGGVAIPSSGAGLVWSSSDTTVAVVNGQGRVTARGNGTAFIRARSGNIADSIAITVAQKPASIKLGSPDYAVSSLGDSVRIIASVVDRRGHAIDGYPLIWSSSRPAEFPVNSWGVVKPVVYGSATISVRASDVQASAIVRVLGGSAPKPPQLIAGLTRINSSTPNFLVLEFLIEDNNADMDSAFVEVYSGSHSLLGSYRFEIDQGWFEYNGYILWRDLSGAMYVKFGVKDAARNQVDTGLMPISIQPVAASPIVETFSAYRIQPDSLHVTASIRDDQFDASRAWIVAFDSYGGFVRSRDRSIGAQASASFQHAIGMRVSSLASVYQVGVMVRDKAGNLSPLRTTTYLPYSAAVGVLPSKQLGNTRATAPSTNIMVHLERGAR